MCLIMTTIITITVVMIIYFFYYHYCLSIFFTILHDVLHVVVVMHFSVPALFQTLTLFLVFRLVVHKPA